MNLPANFFRGPMAMALPIIAVVAVWLAWPHKPVKLTKKWGYDLNNHVLFPVPMDAQAPFPAPSGDLRGVTAVLPAGVEAVVMRIDGSSQKVIAYLAKGDQRNRFISRTDPVVWYKESSQGGAEIAAATRKLYEGKSFDQDFPP